MNIFIFFIVLFVLIFIGSIVTIVYLTKDEKNLKEVSNTKLSSMGKKYTKLEFEKVISDLYFQILEGIENENYNFLRDAMSDQEYNKVLLIKKDEKDNNIENKVTNINKGVVKLIDFRIVNDLEIAKLLLGYSCFEYTLGNREVEKEDGSKNVEKVVVSGSDTNKVFHQYILTFVRSRTNNEEVKCPACGYSNKILTKSRCDGCDTQIVPKKLHWVYTGKVTTNIGE